MPKKKQSPVAEIVPKFLVSAGTKNVTVLCADGREYVLPRSEPLMNLPRVSRSEIGEARGSAVQASVDALVSRFGSSVFSLEV